MAAMALTGAVAGIRHAHNPPLTAREGVAGKWTDLLVRWAKWESWGFLFLLLYSFENCKAT